MKVHRIGVSKLLELEQQRQRDESRRRMRELIATAEAETVRTSHTGPERIVTLAEVLEKRAWLEAQDQPHGVGSLARELKVSESTIKRRLKESRGGLAN